MEELHPSLEPLDFTEALKDSPRFRWNLNQHESYLALLESKLKEVVKQCQFVVEHGKAYVSSFYVMLEAISDLNGTCFKADSTVFTAVERITHAFEEAAKFQKALIEQAHWSIMKNVSDFNKRELSKAQEMRVHFLRVGQSLDDALVKNAQVNKNKEQESFEIRNELTAVGTCYAHTALDYVFQINMAHSRKRFEILEAVFSFLRAYQTYFHQGSDLFGTEWGPTKERLDETLGVLKQNSKQVERKMQDRHMLVPREVFQHPAGMPLDPDVVMEGYLFKRASNAFKTWNRRWFLIRDNKLLYCHRDNDSSFIEKNQVTEDGYTVMEVDLRLCLVRPAPNNVERRHCFELVTPTKNHLLQADSESLCNAWIKALKRSIESALNDSMLSERVFDDRYAQDVRISSNAGFASNVAASNEETNTTIASITTSGGVAVSGAPPIRTIASNSSIASGSSTPQKKRRILDEILSVPGNEICADCGSTDPRWASVNLGITLCIECGASHRSLGVQISKVRSLTLDAWEPEQVKLMTMLGNRKVNEAYLAYLEPSLSVPPPAKSNSSRAARDAWIKAKYLDRQFVFPKQLQTAQANSGEIVVRFRKEKLLARVSAFRGFHVDDSGAIGSNEKKPKNFRSARAKSVAHEALQAVVRRSTRIPAKMKTSRQFCSSPNLRRIDTELAEELAPVVEPTLSSSSYGSEVILNGPLESRDSEEHDECRYLDDNRRLLSAARSADLQAMVESLARGADVNYAEIDGVDNTTPLHAAIISGSVETCEYLLLNGAKINIQDSRGRTPLHLACELGNTAQVCLLLKRGASQELSTIAGESALDISMDLTNADIVTLLRLAKLNEEIKETEFGNGGDDTFVEVVRDISLMASNRPQMLRREQVPPPSSDSAQ